MKDNWKSIKPKIIESIKDIFEESPTTETIDLEELVELFKNVSLHKTGIKKLDGLGESVLESLNEIFSTKPGGVNQLKNIINSIEPFLKKIMYINTGIDYTTQNGKNLIWFFKNLNLLEETSPGVFPVLDETKLKNYIGNPLHLEHLCRAYISRNQVHNSPKIKTSLVYEILDSGLVVYVYAVEKNYTSLVSKVGKNLTMKAHEENYSKYVLSRLSYNPSAKMLESDFGVNIQSIDDFEIKIRAKAKRRKDEKEEYLKDSSKYKAIPLKFLPEIEGVMMNPKYILLHGIATSGKSTILKKLGKNFLEVFDNHYVFYLELGKLFKGRNGNNIEDEITLIYKEVTKLDLKFDHIKVKILILLDGLDEIPSKELRDNVINQVIELKRFNNIQVILTSRTNDYVTNDSKIDNYFEKFELLPVNVNEIIGMGEKILGQGSQLKSFIKIVRKDNLLKAFPKTPLTSMLLAILFKEKDIDIKELPKNISELYSKFIDLFLNRWDVTKGISDQFEIQKKEFVLQTIADHMQKNRLISIPEPELEEFISELSKRKQLGGPSDPKIHLQNLCERTCAIVKDEFDNSYRFFHLTIQEYLSAQKFNIKDDDILVKNFYDEWWLNPNIFYAGKKTDHPDILQRVAKFENYPLDPEHKFNHIAHSSQVLLAAHNIDNSVRNEVIRSMIKMFNEFSKELIDEIITISEFVDEKKAPDKKLAKVKNQSLLDLILTLRDLFMEFFAIHDFENELINIWEEFIYSDEDIEILDITLYCLSYCIAVQTRNAKYLEDFVLTDNITINSRWFRIVDVDISIKNLVNSRRKIMIKIRSAANKNKDYIKKQFNERVSRHYSSLTGMK